MKHAMVTLFLKKPILDASDLGNYRPVSNLSFLSKLIERIVAAQMEHLAALDELPPVNLPTDQTTLQRQL
jgi:hypothetical protein